MRFSKSCLTREAPSARVSHKARGREFETHKSVSDFRRRSAQRKRRELRTTLSDLSDRELMDIGTTSGEIDYVASNRGIDPRTQHEHRSSGLPLKAHIARCSGHVSKVP
jgi:uncharacterized protein YjiS (DUF1127 family)